MPPKSYLFTEANIVDPVKGNINLNAAVYISGGRIISIAYDGVVNVPADTQTIALKGKYLCPGLTDAHVHISAVPGEVDFRHVVSTPEQQALVRMTFVCRDMLRRGFTTARDCGGAPYALKQACEEWLILGPRLFIAGHALSQTGGHGDFRSAHDHTECISGFVSGLGRVCDGVPECLRVARDELRCGADFIKVMAGGGVVSPTDGLLNLQFSPEEIQALVRVADNAKTYVTCHAYTPESIKIAIENGVKGIEHGNLLDQETAELMAEKGVYLTPTLVTYNTLADPSIPQFLTAGSNQKNVKVLNAGFQSLRIAKAAGVTMCYGSDLLGPLGKYQCDEFGLRSKVLPALDILRSATINPARMMGLENSGRIQEGFWADLLVLNSNPLEDITVLQRYDSELLAVIKEGRFCHSKLPDITGLLDEFAKL
jgi:imidazolonepropionase-like amidohydrolase